MTLATYNTEKGSLDTADDRDNMTGWASFGPSEVPVSRGLRGAGLAKRLREADSDKTNIDGLREAEDGRVESSEGSGGMVVTGHGELDLLHFFLPSLSLFLKCSGLAL